MRGTLCCRAGMSLIWLSSFRNVCIPINHPQCRETLERVTIDVYAAGVRRRVGDRCAGLRLCGIDVAIVPLAGELGSTAESGGSGVAGFADRGGAGGGGGGLSGDFAKSVGGSVSAGSQQRGVAGGFCLAIFL